MISTVRVSAERRTEQKARAGRVVPERADARIRRTRWGI
jgi:hypothetical protein